MTSDSPWVEIGGRVREARLAAGMSQEELGARIGLDRTMITKIEAGTRRLDALELSRLASVLAMPISYFLHAPPAVVSRRLPLTDEEPETTRSTFKLEAVLSSWLRDVRQLIDLGLLEPARPLRYQRPVPDPEAAREAARWVRAELSSGTEPLDSMLAVCERAGQFLLVTELPGDGASLIDDDLGVAVVNSRGEPGRRRATAAHELGHFVLGDGYSNDVGIHASRQDREQVVEAFAAELLLPVEVFRSREWAEAENVRNALVRLAARYRTSWSLALSQAERAGMLDTAQRARLRASAPTRAEFMQALGWTPEPDLESARVPPRYADAVLSAWRQGLVTSARAVELMHGRIEEDDLPRRMEDDEDLW